VATAIVDEWKQHGCDLKPMQLAERLGIAVTKAKKLILYQARKIRAEIAKEALS